MHGVYKEAEIVTIPFPFSELGTAKARPVLLVSSSDEYGDFICLAVTSKMHHKKSIALNQNDMEDGQLPLASWVRTDKVYTLNNTQVIKRICSVKAVVYESILKELCNSLGCCSKMH